MCTFVLFLDVVHDGLADLVSDGLDVCPAIPCADAVDEGRLVELSLRHRDADLPPEQFGNSAFIFL
jgi:hypothetical protein